MRKIVIILVLMLCVFLAYQTIVVGFEISPTFSIPNYKKIGDSSRTIDTLISQLVNVNDIEFANQKTSLTSSIRTYKDKKEEYDSLSAMVEENTDKEVSLVDMYDVDFLWTVIGNYGTEEGIKLIMDVVKSTSATAATSSSTEYMMCDLKFTVSGDYIAITDFIYDIEKDNKLGFEISDFSLAKGGDNLQATFIVKEVPINNENLTELTKSVETTNTNTTNTNTTVTGTPTTDTNTSTTATNTTVY